MSRRTRNKAANTASPSITRKSTAVPLVLAAGAMLTGCGSNYQQDEYANFNDCVHDWEKPELCQPRKSGTTSSGGTHWRYYGPSYEEGHRDAYQRNVRSAGFQSSRVSSDRSISRSSVSRGGFGGSSHGGSSGG